MLQLLNHFNGPVFEGFQNASAAEVFLKIPKLAKFLEEFQEGFLPFRDSIYEKIWIGRFSNF